MRVRALILKDFRSLHDIVLDPEGLVVLFGPNSSGKTTVLEAVRELLAGTSEMRRDPFGEETGDPYVDGSVVFELVGAGLPEHPDSQLHRRLFTGELSAVDAEWPWSFIGHGAASLIRGLELAEAQEFVAQSLVELPGPGSPSDRLEFANDLLQTRFFQSTSDETWLVALPDEMSVEARESARRIVEAGDGADDADPLLEDAGATCEGRLVHVAGVADGFIDAEIQASFGGFIDINAETVGLLTIVHDDIVAIHDKMWAYAMDVKTAGGITIQAVDNFQISGAIKFAGRYNLDTWLEAQGDDVEATVFELDTGANAAMRWHRVRPSLIAATQLLERHANALAPTFVRELGHIRVNVLPPMLWHQEPSRVRVAFEEDGGLRDLGVLGAGISRWISASLRLAGHELRTADRVVRRDGREIVDPAEQAEGVKLARRDPLAQTAVALERRKSATPVTHLVDEPEAHLHPRAVSSIADWIVNLLDRGHQVVLATHDPGLLTRLGDRARFLLTTKVDGVTRLRDIGGNLEGGLETANAQLGLTLGEVLLLTRLALFVEGPHDQAVLHEMFGDDLSSAGVRVFPIHGIDNALAMVDSEVVASLGIRMAVLADNLDRSRIGKGEASTREERATLRLLREAKRSGKRISPFGLQAPDIVWYLDEEVCRSMAPTFPGWERAARMWIEAGRPAGFKDYVTSKFGLKLDRDSVSRLAGMTLASGRIPHELDNVVRAICALAASSR